MSAGSEQVAAEPFHAALTALLAQSSTPNRLIDLLVHLDAERSAGIIVGLADRCRPLGRAVAQLFSDENEPPAEATTISDDLLIMSVSVRPPA